MIALKMRSLYSLGTAAIFLFFLAASAPHRVHHLLENLPPPQGDFRGMSLPSATDLSAEAEHRHSHAHSHSHDAAPARTQAAPAPDSAAEPLHANAPKRDANHDGSTRTDCIVQAAAQHAPLALPQSAQIFFVCGQFALRLAVGFVNFTPFDPSPLSQRAPPGI